MEIPTKETIRKHLAVTLIDDNYFLHIHQMLLDLLQACKYTVNIEGETLCAIWGCHKMDDYRSAVIPAHPQVVSGLWERFGGRYMEIIVETIYTVLKFNSLADDFSILGTTLLNTQLPNTLTLD